jgi:hypothetical protein
MTCTRKGLLVLIISGPSIKGFVRIYYSVVTRDALGPHEAYTYV